LENEIFEIIKKYCHIYANVKKLAIEVLIVEKMTQIIIVHVVLIFKIIIKILNKINEIGV